MTAPLPTATHSPNAALLRPLLVRELPPEDRPATRVREQGARHCSLSELLATVFDGPQALTYAHKVLTAYGSDPRLMMGESAIQLAARAGIPRRAATQLHAALEIGRRVAGSPKVLPTPVRNPRDVYHFMQHLEDAQVEEFHVLILDAQHRAKRSVTISRGILNSSLVHPREVFKEAIAESAATIILVHNHPSGDPTPSPDDCFLTQQLVAAGKLLDIQVHDHVIIGRGTYTSLAEQGRI